MIYKKIYKILFIILITFFIIITSGCVYQKVNIQDLVNQPIEEMGNYNQSKKYIKAGIKVVYLEGSPYEIGFAHGKLCKNEIKNVNKIYWDYYDYHNKQPDDGGGPQKLDNVLS